jgi:hypothetical protein
MKTLALALSVAGTCLALSPALADSFDIPARKAGQWKIEMHLPVGNQKIVTELCLDENTDRQLMQAGVGMTPECTTTKNGSGFDSVCNFGGMKTTSHIEISGDFQSSYTMKISTDHEGAPAGVPKHSEITQTATWEGACKGLKPGEMLMPGGMKMDALNVLKPGG